MSVTPLMNLTLPEVTVTLGPTWANEVNAAFNVIDAHDHSSGQGTKVTVAGLNINANLDFNNKKAFNLFSSQYKDVSTPLTGASNSSSVSTSSGNLYFTNGSGVSIQLTDGGAIVSAPGAVESFQYDTLAANLIIGPSDTFVYIGVDTTSSRSITLPLANAVAAGRIYIFKDIDGLSNTNNITITRSGSDTIDGATSKVIDSDLSSTWLIGDGVSRWLTS